MALSTGANALFRQRNLFDLRAEPTIIACVSGLILASLLYLLVIHKLNDDLANAIAGNDVLSVVLKTSPFYPEPKSAGGGGESVAPTGPAGGTAAGAANTALAAEGETNDLALGIWIRYLKLAAADQNIGEILDDERFGLLQAALRTGDSCPVEGQPTGRPEPLAIPTVDRLINLARFLGNTDCADNLGNDGRNGIAAGLVRQIAGLEPLPAHGGPCATALHPILIWRPVTGGAPVAVPSGCANYLFPVSAVSGRQLVTWLFEQNAVNQNVTTAALEDRQAKALVASAKTQWDLAVAATGEAAAARDAAKTAVDAVTPEAPPPEGQTVETLAAALTEKEAHLAELTTAQANAQKAYDSAVTSATQLQAKSEAKETARSRLIDLYGTRTANDAKLGLEDEQLRAIEDFAIGLIAAIDTDPAVSSARRWLSAYRGPEQFCIFALFFVTLMLVGARYLAYRRNSRDVDGAVAIIEGLQLPTPPAGGLLTKAQQLALADGRLKTMHGANLHAISTTAVPRTELTTDMVRATLADLSQLRLYGLSDERTEQVAVDLKDKVSASRTIIDWCIATLPALGFLGTVRGILDALSGVSGLTQGDAAARLQTLLQVSGSLGLAFATTLFALLGMLVLSFLDVRQTNDERSLIDEFRDYLTDRVLP
ncbi:MotA/TolQ/ExbB proton channel family protein [Devosia sp.]|uniref:MotA/TolQ/ExbB proton channel family protein n=1 Tax=Devosia sp. TaxID=1871048 RepID=UPI003F6F3A06